jgi:hypothetical protein
LASSNPTGGAPDPAEVQPKRGKRTTCGYCDCVLDADGEIISMGKKAKEFRAMSENDETRIKRIETLETEIADLKKKLAETPAPRTEAVSAESKKGKGVLDTIVPLRS